MVDSSTAGVARRPSFISSLARPRLVDHRPRADGLRLQRLYGIQGIESAMATLPAYEERTLAYFDVLGWSDLISASRDEPGLLVELEDVLSPAEDLHKALGRESGIQLAQFSDHVCISALADTGLGGVCVLAASLVVNMLHLGFCARGAIVLGKLVHRGNRVYGPALLEAHYIESRVAVYPRLVLSDEVVSRLGTIGNPSIQTIRDTDGLEFLDVMSLLPADRRAGACRKMAAAVKSRIAPAERELAVRAKRGWLFQYLASAERSSQPG